MTDQRHTHSRYIVCPKSGILTARAGALLAIALMDVTSTLTLISTPLQERLTLNGMSFSLMEFQPNTRVTHVH
jgi:hypothetical protein